MAILWPYLMHFQQSVTIGVFEISGLSPYPNYMYQDDRISFYKTVTETVTFTCVYTRVQNFCLRCMLCERMKYCNVDNRVVVYNIYGYSTSSADVIEYATT